MKLQFIKSLWPYIKVHKNKAWGAFFLTFVLAGLKVYQAYLVKPIFDKGLSDSGSLNDALFLAGLLFSVLLISLSTQVNFSIFPKTPYL